MSLQGSLIDLPLIDLVQVLTFQNKTGILSINREFSQAQVCFAQSSIISAYIRQVEKSQQPRFLQGEEAVYDLLSWCDGQFCFELVATLPQIQNVCLKMDYLILEYCRRKDEQAQWQMKRKPNAIPRLAHNPPERAEINLLLEDWQVLLQINGQTSLEGISHITRQNFNQVLEVIARLEKQGLVEWAEATPKVLVAGVSVGISWQGRTNSSPSPTKSTAVASLPVYKSPAVQVVAPAPCNGPQMVPAQTFSRPKVQRNLISGIMARIRGL